MSAPESMTKARDRGLSMDGLRSIVNYDPTTGQFRYHNKVVEAGWTEKDGYKRLRVRGRKYLQHRLAWLYVHGAWPSYEIDHIDGVRGNNRIANLRDVTCAANTQNQRKAHRQGVSGFLGVCWSKSEKKYRAQISLGGKKRIIGRFNDPEAAHAAYVAEKRRIHPGWADALMAIVEERSRKERVVLFDDGPGKGRAA